MGYKHYYWVPKEFDAKAFAKVAVDFKKMITPLKHLGVILADGAGENHPTISPTEICFNGLANCGHTERSLGIVWPSKTASGVSENKVDSKLGEITKSTWCGGAELAGRACDGDCSHETFSLEQKLEMEFEPQENSVYVNKQDKKSNKCFDSTKTAYKPYDLAVTVCLVIAKHHLGDDIVVESDGRIKHWKDAMQLCQQFLGYGLKFNLDTYGGEDENAVEQSGEDVTEVTVTLFGKNKEDVPTTDKFLLEPKEETEESVNSTNNNQT